MHVQLKTTGIIDTGVACLVAGERNVEIRDVFRDSQRPFLRAACEDESQFGLDTCCFDKKGAARVEVL